MPGSLGNTWYWNESGASSGAPAITLEYRRIVEVNEPTSAILRGAVDDFIDRVEVNGQVMSSVNSPFDAIRTVATFNLLPGKNVVAITVRNGSGPAGFVFEIRKADGTLLAPVPGWFGK